MVSLQSTKTLTDQEVFLAAMCWMLRVYNRSKQHDGVMFWIRGLHGGQSPSVRQSRRLCHLLHSRAGNRCEQSTLLNAKPLLHQDSGYATSAQF